MDTQSVRELALLCEQSSNPELVKLAQEIKYALNEDSIDLNTEGSRKNWEGKILEKAFPEEHGKNLPKSLWEKIKQSKNGSNRRKSSS